MASAQVTLKVAPDELVLLIDALLTHYESNQDIAGDIAVKEGDRALARSEMFRTRALAIQLGASPDNYRDPSHS